MVNEHTSALPSEVSIQCTCIDDNAAFIGQQETLHDLIQPTEYQHSPVDSAPW